ncbi:hypothetical protein V4U86_23620 [Mycobacterium sp. AMU20-3851]|uniref:hypothetical protein n=1 Tax=Mycobacterium sp. AMU20-3851 TaxID=3122055 RepID=UPI0037543536
MRLHSMFAAAAAAVTTALALAAAPGAQAETAPTLPVFVPYPSAWSPDYSLFPYNLWQIRVTPEQVTAQRDACQWFNAQYGDLTAQVHGFKNFLDEVGDNWSAPGVQQSADVVTANLNQSAAFLDPRVHTLYITNYPDQSQYSPLYNGDSFYHLWYQYTQISDKIRQQLPSGQIHANVVTADVYGNVIRDSGICERA